MEKIRLILADDHPKVRSSMRTRLTHESDLEIVGEAANSMQMIKHTLATLPQVILIDPIMRDGKGIEAIERIRAKFPDIVIVVLTALVDPKLTVELRKAGARVILPKGTPTEEILRVLRESVVTKP